MEADAVEQGCREGLASAGGYGYCDAGLLGGKQCALIAGADGGGEVREQGAIHVDSNKTHGMGKLRGKLAGGVGEGRRHMA